MVKHLSKPYHIKNKEGIVRVLAVKEAKGIACSDILYEYYKAPKENLNYRWAFDNTLAVVITIEYIDDVIAIVLDESNGESRHMFVAALGKLKSPKAKKALQQLLNDKSDLIRKEALKALQKFN